MAADALVYLGRAPRLRPPLLPPEVAVLRAVGKGIAASELRARMGKDWDNGALFALLGRRFLTLTAAEAAAPDAWASYLG